MYFQVFREINHTQKIDRRRNEIFSFMQRRERHSQKFTLANKSTMGKIQIIIIAKKIGLKFTSYNVTFPLHFLVTSPTRPEEILGTQ